MISYQANQGANVMSWKKVTLTSADISAGRERALQEEFGKRWMALGAPSKAVMYGNRDVIREGHQFFFSPAAFEIAAPLLKAYEVVDCPVPASETFVVLVKNSTGPGPG
jgi:hypothetical protein